MLKFKNIVIICVLYFLFSATIYVQCAVILDSRKVGCKRDGQASYKIEEKVDVILHFVQLMAIKI